MRFFLLLVSMSTSFALGCSTAAPGEELTEDVSGAKADTVPRVLVNVRSLPDHGDDVDLGDVRLDGSILEIDVAYSHGHESPTFELYWDGAIAEGYPGATTLRLVHDAHGELGEGYRTRTLRFDVSELVDRAPLVVSIEAPGDQVATFDVPDHDAPTIPRLTTVAELPGHGDDFHLLTTRIAGSVLEVDVGYSSGSQRHGFELFWDGTVRDATEDALAGVSLLLVHDAHGELAERYTTRTLRFDISALAPHIPLSVGVSGPNGGHSIAYIE